eukprot:scaffold4022_cov122-Isochrysis_galbana.AAC.9
MMSINQCPPNPGWSVGCSTYIGPTRHSAVTVIEHRAGVMGLEEERRESHLPIILAPPPSKKKIFSRNARHASGSSTGHLCPLPTGHSPPPFPFISHPFSLFRPSVAEGWCPSCVHYNSLGWGIESLGFIVVLQPMSASLSPSLRADYGGALNRCVAIFGRADQHSVGAEGAPYRLSI